MSNQGVVIMLQPKHILVPTDGSDDSVNAAKFAGELARNFGAKVSVLIVQDDRLLIPEAWGMAAGTQGSVEEARADFERRAINEELVPTKEAVGDVDAGVDAQLVWGHAPTEICQFAEANDVDLIVLGSHGRSGIKRLLLGSVSNAVANTAPCSVTIVR